MSEPSHDDRHADAGAEPRAGSSGAPGGASTGGPGQPTGPPPGEQAGPEGRSATEDPNLVAIERAAVEARMSDWLHQVAAQVDPRLDRVAPGWRQAEQAEAARACTFGLLLAHLAATYPHARDTIDRVAEEHPSYSTLTSGERLATLERIAGEPGTMAAWVGPLIGVNDPAQVSRLLE